MELGIFISKDSPIFVIDQYITMQGPRLNVQKARN